MWQEAHHGAHGDALAAAGLPHQGEGLPFGDGKRHAVRDLDRARLPGEGYRKILDFQQHRFRSYCL